MIDTYIRVGKSIVDSETSNLNLNVFYEFIQYLEPYEVNELKDKYSQRHRYMDDIILERHFSRLSVDFSAYKLDYYTEKLGPSISPSTLCAEYVRGLQWVIHYYTKGIQSWDWCYPYHYAPFLNDLCYFKVQRIPSYAPSSPLSPFEQLLSVLPPQSMYLLPSPLDALATDPNSPLREYYPHVFDVDLSGKRVEWQGIVLLPFVNVNRVRNVYKTIDKCIDAKELVRNRKERARIYYVSKEMKPYTFKNFYGDIPNARVAKRFF